MSLNDLMVQNQNTISAAKKHRTPSQKSQWSKLRVENPVPCPCISQCSNLQIHNHHPCSLICPWSIPPLYHLLKILPMLLPGCIVIWIIFQNSQGFVVTWFLEKAVHFHGVSGRLCLVVLLFMSASGVRLVWTSMLAKIHVSIWIIN